MDKGYRTKRQLESINKAKSLNNGDIMMLNGLNNGKKCRQSKKAQAMMSHRQVNLSDVLCYN